MTEKQAAVLGRIRELDDSNEPWSYGSLAKDLGLPRSTVQTIVGVLRGGGSSITDPDRRPAEDKVTLSYNSSSPVTVEEVIRGGVSNPDEWVNPRSTIIDRKLVSGKWTHGRTVYLERKQPDPPVPEVRPIYVDNPPAIVRTKEDLGTEVITEVILSDTHVGYERNTVDGSLEPYTDRRAIDVALQICDDIEPDGITHLGDVLDAAEISRWEDSQTAEMFLTMQPAMVETSWMFHELKRRALTVTYAPGNHDIRAEKLLRKRAPALANMRSVSAGPDSEPVMSIASICGLSDMGVRILDLYPDGKVWYNDNVCAIHGTRASAGPGSTAAALLKDFQCSVIQGHRHAGEQVYTSSQGKGRHKTRCATVAHCLARLDGIIPGTTNDNNWTNGITILQYIPGDGEFFVTNVPIIRGRAIYDGRLYAGSDYAEKLTGYCDWDFPFKEGSYRD